MLLLTTLPRVLRVTLILEPAKPPAAPPTAAAPAVVILLTAEPILLLAPPGTIHEASSGTNLISMAPTNNPTTYIQVLPMPCIPKPPISPQV